MPFVVERRQIPNNSFLMNFLLFINFFPSSLMCIFLCVTISHNHIGDLKTTKFGFNQLFFTFYLNFKTFIGPSNVPYGALKNHKHTTKECLTILFVFSVTLSQASRSEFIIQFFNSHKLFNFNAHPSVNKRTFTTCYQFSFFHSREFFISVYNDTFVRAKK